MLLSFLQGDFDLWSFLQDMLLSLPAFVLALSMHEAAHGFVAYRLGDPTAMRMGRVTLNPLKHLDPMGFLCMFLAGVGWAKPVPIDPRYFKNPRRDDLLVSLAGITMNLIQFVIGCLAMYAVVFFALGGQTRLIQEVDGVRYGFTATEAYVMATGMRAYLIAPKLGAVWGYAYEIIARFAVVNLVLAVFNLIPVPPLDGYHVLNDLLLKKPLFAPLKAQRIGQAVVMLLAVTGLLSKGLGFIMNGVFDNLGALAAHLLA